MSATSAPDQSESMTVDSDFVLVLAALLCALICVVGLIAVARCAWLRRTTDPTPDPTVVPDKGLKKSAIQFLPKLTLKGDGEGDCPICLSGFVPGEEMRVLPHCGHGFHVLCIDTWLRSHSSCPSCRRILQVATCNNCGGLQDSSTSTDLETGFKTTQHHHPNSFLP